MTPQTSWPGMLGIRGLPSARRYVSSHMSSVGVMPAARTGRAPHPAPARAWARPRTPVSPGRHGHVIEGLSWGAPRKTCEGLACGSNSGCQVHEVLKALADELFRSIRQRPSESSLAAAFAITNSGWLIGKRLRTEGLSQMIRRRRGYAYVVASPAADIRHAKRPPAFAAGGGNDPDCSARRN